MSLLVSGFETLSEIFGCTGVFLAETQNEFASTEPVSYRQVNRQKSQSLAWTVIAGCVVFTAWFIPHRIATVQNLSLTPMTWSLVAVQTSIELLASFYGFAFALGAVVFL